MLLTFKTVLAGQKPYNTLRGDEYVALLKANEAKIHQGCIGVYLARKVIVQDQELYQPLIDIDGGSDLDGDSKIESAIQFAEATLRVLKKYGAGEHFKFIATGGTGFRAISNFLLNREAYQAFANFVRYEMPHITDLGPTVETDRPHQVLAFKGHSDQTSKELVDGHSAVIDVGLLAQDAFSVHDYRATTAGKPEPAEVIQLVEWLLSGTLISDLNSLGAFGKRLAEYLHILSELNFDPFSYIQLRSKIKPVGLEVMQEMLEGKGMLSRVEQRGRSQAISFKGLPCPLCGKIDSNARAYPPAYALRCFNSNCPANKGIPLRSWAGFKLKATHNLDKRGSFDLAPPNTFVSIEQAREIISKELNTPDDALIVLTPGVGKTHKSLQTIAAIGTDKVIIYGAFNKDLQREAYEKICALSGQSDRFILILPREETCLKRRELVEITAKGFSPAELLCATCEHRQSECQYYAQRKEFGPGIYFVTLHMLQYLQDRIPKPHLIILDENLKAGFMLEESCSESQIRSLLKVLKGGDAVPVIQLITLGQQIVTKMASEGTAPMILNGRKLTESDIHETTVIELLSKRLGKTETEITADLARAVDALNKRGRAQLYRDGIDLKAVRWLEGLFLSGGLSYLVFSDRGDVSYRLKYITPLGFRGTPVKILDATVDARAIEPLVRRRLKTVRADVGWNSYRVHIKLNTGRTVINRAEDSRLTAILAEMLAHTQAPKIMVITYKRQKERVMRLLQTIDPSREFMDYHFIGPRGVNKFMGCDAVLVLGLPYANLNSSAQDACILFPEPITTDLRADWTEAMMQWELLQNVHRIRPVNKLKVDIVVAAGSWPSILPAPDIIIDRSQSKTWKELAISRLKPFVDEFGFLNQDIGFLANVYLKSKDKIAGQFQKNFSRILSITNQEISQVNFSSGVFIVSEGCTYEGNILDDNAQVNQVEDIKLKLIFVIYNILNKNLLTVKYPVLNQLKILLEKHQIDWSIPDCNPSNTNQWAELLIHFKNENPHFESFKIKLPHARGNYVSGVGDPNRVKAFYQSLNDLGVIGKIDLGTYTVIDNNTIAIEPILDGYASVCIPDGGDHAFVGIGSDIKVVSLRDGIRGTVLEQIAADAGIEIITNNGKALAKVIMATGLPDREIIDVVLAEKLVLNGEVELRSINLQSILKRQGYDIGERRVTVRRLYDVWLKQEEMVRAFCLVDVLELEQRVIWVTARIEMTGVAMDVDGLLHYRETILARLNAADGGSDMRLTAEFECIESYLSLIGSDDRIRDSIDQLNTRTGRFYRLLQTVKKDGPLRSFFRARQGYKLIVADYSQQEARIIAALSGDRAAIGIFKAGKDIYLEVAAALLGRPPVQCQNYRNLAKEIVLGLNNGRSAYSICDQLEQMGFHYDVDDIHGFILRYNILFDGIKRWREDTAENGKRSRLLATRLGRLLKVSSNVNENSLCNFPVQATAADGFKRALVLIDEKLRDLDAQVVHILHDEVIVEAGEDIAEWVALTVKESMEEGFKNLLSEVLFHVEPAIRDVWKASKAQ